MNGHLICNTGPLIALAMVDRIGVLSDLFGRVSVPLAVHEEMLAGGQCGFGLASYERARWLQRLTLGVPPDPLLVAMLDRGEAEVLQAASIFHADWVLIDERKARRIARSVYGLRVIGTAGILVEAKRSGAIPEVRNLLAQMRGQGYRIHDSIVERALLAAGE